MGKRRVGNVKQFTLVEGDVGLLTSNEVLISKEEGYFILRRRKGNGNIETYVLVPLSDFKKEESEEEVKH